LSKLLKNPTGTLEEGEFPGLANRVLVHFNDR